MNIFRWKMSAKLSFTFQHFKFPLLPLLTHSALCLRLCLPGLLPTHYIRLAPNINKVRSIFWCCQHSLGCNIKYTTYIIIWWFRDIYIMCKGSHPSKNTVFLWNTFANGAGGSTGFHISYSEIIKLVKPSIFPLIFPLI